MENSYESQAKVGIYGIRCRDFGTRHHHRGNLLHRTSKAQSTDLPTGFDDLVPPPLKFNKIQCRQLEVVDKDGKKAIGLYANNRANIVKVWDKLGKGKEAVILQSDEYWGQGNTVQIFSPLGGEAILLRSGNSINWFSIADREHSDLSAFKVFSDQSVNLSARWIRARGTLRGRLVDW